MFICSKLNSIARFKFWLITYTAALDYSSMDEDKLIAFYVNITNRDPLYFCFSDQKCFFERSRPQTIVVLLKPKLTFKDSSITINAFCNYFKDLQQYTSTHTEIFIS